MKFSNVLLFLNELKGKKLVLASLLLMMFSLISTSQAEPLSTVKDLNTALKTSDFCTRYRFDDPNIVIDFSVEAPRVRLYIYKTGEICSLVNGMYSTHYGVSHNILSKDETIRLTSIIHEFFMKTAVPEKKYLGASNKLDCAPACGYLELRENGKSSTLITANDMIYLKYQKSNSPDYVGFETSDIKTYKLLSDLLGFDLKDEIVKTMLGAQVPAANR